MFLKILKRLTCSALCLIICGVGLGSSLFEQLADTFISDKLDEKIARFTTNEFPLRKYSEGVQIS
jgi:hypothetical protein